jgi:hypothetical protein
MDRKIATKRSTETKTERNGSERRSAGTAKTQKIPHLPTSRERDRETFRYGNTEPKSESKCKYRKLGLLGLRYPHLVPNL